MRTVSLVVEALYDLWLQYAPSFLVSRRNEYAYAFLIHPRDFSDIYRKYPFLKPLPKSLLAVFARNFWPVVVSRITGLPSEKHPQKEVRGYVITIALTASQMLADRPLAIRRIRQAMKLASRKGAHIIGLGALTASVTGGGLELIDNGLDIAVTTGHAYTAFNITEYVRTLQRILDIPETVLKIAVVGAAGSVGSTCAKILARAGYQNILLVDVQRKNERFKNLPDELRSLNQKVATSISHNINDVKTADFIITATNAPEAVVRSKDVRPGTFIIDDAQPSDIASEVFDRKDVVVLEAGAVHTPGITAHFNMGLQDRFDNFCCLAEVLLLASKHRDTHYVINRATLELVDEIAEEGKRLGFTVSRFQNDREFISESHMEKVSGILRERYSHVHRA